MATHKGGCHCGRIRLEVEAPADLLVDECNCSMCNMVGYQHLIVPKSDFSLLQGEEHLTTYQFNTGVAKHYFCSHCLDGDTINSVTIEPFDGRNWEQNRDKLAPLPE